MEALMKVENLEKYYGTKTLITKAIKNISFTIESHEFTGIMGASGSGKSTLLNCISTIDTATAGHIYLNGKDLTKLKEKELAKFRQLNLGFIFQDFNLLDTLTMEENIALSLTIANVDSKEIEARVKDIAIKLGIGDIMMKFPYEVSGGQRQRCACARAMINKPEIILADEPTGALDSKSAAMLLDTLYTMNQSMGATILMVTHDVFTASYCKRIIFLKDGKLFSEIFRGNQTRTEFFHRILDTVTLLGGESGDAQ
ncbi:ABC transporter ATP-binding protein [Anaerocolumna sp. AGMB13020]|uniref:ABC transporter ATP-binding protein n=1 Tax=Anaerocolumna sp. AGMB13020 TaxID=3081750 RepID=UPI002952AA54|nr:ABC transporter ATP-binding protein [Anaerocolumna sp. AGMB13020]WOO35571.1 ABC transporter ATP-binding protein [Anaerocolumna sp. AGMB13020]